MVNYHVHKQAWAQIIVFGTTISSTGRVDRNWTESGGKAPQPGLLLVGELVQVLHYPETRASPGGHLRHTGSLGIE